VPVAQPRPSPPPTLRPPWLGTISAQALLAWRVAGPVEEVPQTDRWNAEALRAVRELASDLSSLLTSLEVTRHRRGEDKAIQRSYLLAASMQQSLERLITLLRT
jgi:hypothetical protein